MYDPCCYVITINGRAVCDNILEFENIYDFLELIELIRQSNFGLVKIIEKPNFKNPMIYEKDTFFTWLLERSKIDYQKISYFGYELYGLKSDINIREMNKDESNVEDYSESVESNDLSIDIYENLMEINEKSHDMDDWDVR